MSAGYDDNADKSPDARGSGFLLGKALLSKTLAYEPNIYTAGIYAKGQHQDYFRFGERYSATLGASGRKEFLDGLLTGDLFCEGNIYRDELKPEDDFDGVSVGAGGSWLMSGQSELVFRQSFSWNDFRGKTTVSVPSGSGGDGGRGGQGGPGNSGGPGGPGGSEARDGTGWQGGPGKPPKPRYFERNRDDVLSLTELSLVFYLGPSVTALFTGEHRINGSSVESESYDSNGLHFTVKWAPEKKWQCVLSLSGTKYDFDQDYRQRSRSDKVRAAGLQISRFIDAFEVYARVDLTDSDSNFERENYRRTVTQCGISWSF